MLKRLMNFLTSSQRLSEKQNAYSCEVDQDPDCFFQSLFLISTLLELVNVTPDNIFIHHIGVPDPGVAKIYQAIGVNFTYSLPDGEENHNQNTSVSSELAAYEKVIFCDCTNSVRNLLPVSTDTHQSDQVDFNYQVEFNKRGLLKLTGNLVVDKEISRVNDAHEKYLARLTSEAPDLGGLLHKRRQRWLEWNNEISKRPLPLPDHMGCEKPLIAIETGGQCNYRCSYCPVSHTTMRKGKLDTMTFQSLINEVMPHDGSFQLRFHFYNEPLLDSRLPELISYAKKRLPNTYVRLVSNGELLDVDAASILFSSGVDQIAVSCHKKEVFQRLHELKSHHLAWNLELRPSFSESKWSDRRGLIDLKSHGFSRSIPAGVKPWGCDFLTLQIDYLGKVHMCCEDFNGDLILGDVTKEGLKSILGRNQGQLKRAYCGFFDSTCVHCAGLDL